MSAALSTTEPDATTAVANLIRWLETGVLADDLFAADLFADVTFPEWRQQTDTAQGLLDIRRQQHPFAGTVQVQRVDPTDRGFVMEFEERWEHQGRHWFAREVLRADVVGPTIVEASIWCTGDWEDRGRPEHAAAVPSVRS